MTETLPHRVVMGLDELLRQARSHHPEVEIGSGDCAKQQQEPCTLKILHCRNSLKTEKHAQLPWRATESSQTRRETPIGLSPEL